MSTKLTLAALNALDRDAFIARLGGIFEHSPWVARHAAATRPFATREAMVRAFVDAVGAAGRESQLALLRAHPDLATKARLTPDSTREQAAAGMGALTAAEFERFTRLNDLYKSKFDFPFIFAVKGATKQQILASFAERVNSDPDLESATAVAQVCRIFRFRIEDRVSS